MDEIDLPDLSVSFDSLESRAMAAVSKLSGLFDLRTEDATVRSIVDFLSMQHEDGCWGSDDYPILKPVFTAQGMQALQSLGMVAIENGSDGNDRYLQARRWLEKAQRTDGAWGEDAFDTCECVKALIAAGLPATEPSISKAANYLRGLVDRNWDFEPSFWSGTGFIGSAVEVFNLLEDAKYAHLALSQLTECFDARLGYFTRGATRPSDAIAAPPEWHTACALLALRSFGPVLPEPSAFRQSLAWLKAAQSPQGSWCPGHDEITSICTYEVIVALTAAEGFHSQEARRGTEWLLKQSEQTTASQPGYNARFMAAAAVARTHHNELSVLIDLVLLENIRTTLDGCARLAKETDSSYRHARDEVRGLISSLQTSVEDTREASARVHKLEQQTETLRTELERSRTSVLELQQKLTGYGLKLTNNQVAVLGILLTLLTFFAGLFVALALNK